MLLQFFSLETGVTYVVPVHSVRYLLVGGTRLHHFTGTNLKPRKVLENAQTPTRRGHAVLAGLLLQRTLFLKSIL
jgi:hypothetical protein